MKVLCLFLLLLASSLEAFAQAKVRKVDVKNDQIITVKVALGVATIIQVPDRPNSIVVGDQAGFKVEYLDQAITIKPLTGSARSNLYIYTDYRRYNVQLVTTHQKSADYIVYLENYKEKIAGSKLSWMNFRNYLKNDSIVLETKRLARTRDGFLLVEFEIGSAKRESFKPEWVWLTQSGLVRPIHGLILSAQEVSPSQKIRGILQVVRNDISESEPLKIELRRTKTSVLNLPKVSSWK